MQISRMVVLITSGLFASGCYKDHDFPTYSEKPVEGCRFADSIEREKIISAAEKIFSKEVGVEIESMKTSTPSVCGSETLTMIQARTKNMSTPRIWLVKIDINDPTKFDLLRPE